MPQELTPEIVRAAIAGFQQERLQIEAQIAELRAMLSSPNRETNFARKHCTKAKAIQRRIPPKNGLGTKSKMGTDQGRI